jgi:ribosomal protein S18 acetylase RimI-like enzyme
MSIEIREANLRDAEQGQGFLQVLESYAQSATGGGQPLAEDAKARLLPALAEQPHALVLMAWFEGRAVGIATCFFGFSTFAARPLLNVHDLAVLPALQGRGIGRALLASAAEHARARGCVKLTLEVLEDNHGARRLYESLGFADYELGGVRRRTLFLTKPLGD